MNATAKCCVAEVGPQQPMDASTPASWTLAAPWRWARNLGNVLKQASGQENRCSTHVLCVSNPAGAIDGPPFHSCLTSGVGWGGGRQSLIAGARVHEDGAVA